LAISLAKHCTAAWFLLCSQKLLEVEWGYWWTVLWICKNRKRPCRWYGPQSPRKLWKSGM